MVLTLGTRPYRLANEVDWEDEKACFANIAREMGELFKDPDGTHAPPPAAPADEAVAATQASQPPDVTPQDDRIAGA